MKQKGAWLGLSFSNDLTELLSFGKPLIEETRTISIFYVFTERSSFQNLDLTEEDINKIHIIGRKSWILFKQAVRNHEKETAFESISVLCCFI